MGFRMFSCAPSFFDGVLGFELAATCPNEVHRLLADDVVESLRSRASRWRAGRSSGK